MKGTIVALLVAPALLGAQVPNTTNRPVVLPTIETRAVRPEREAFEEAPNVGRLTIRTSALTSSPRFFGESDVLRAARTLPGVNARNDYSVGMNVRGGETDQNLVLLDGFPIYNPFHMGGIFGAFVEPMVDQLDFHAGGFPARYGERLSSVIDVRSRAEQRSGLHGSANLSMIASTLALGAATHNGRHSWNVAARRTYADKVVDLFHENGVPYHFRDAQIRTTHVLPRGWSASATWYDNLDELTQPADLDDELGLAWGNRVAGVTVARSLGLNPRIGRISLGDSARFEQRASRSDFSLRMHSINGALSLRNTVRDMRLGGSITGHRPSGTRTIGYDVGVQNYFYQASYPLVIYPADTMQTRNATYGVYVDEQWRPTIRWLIQGGLRLDGVAPVNRLYALPRLSAKYFVSPDLAISAAYGEYAQAAHTLAREDVPIRALDFWVGSDARAPMSRSRHFIAGVEQWLPANRAVRVEVFLKQYPSLVEQNPHSDPSVDGDEFVRLHGHSWGADIVVRQFDRAGLTGWLSYNFVFNRRVDQNGRAFFPAQDRRHEANLVLNRQLGRYVLSSRFNVATGTPYTRILGQYVGDDYNPATQRTSTDHSLPRWIGGPRNAERLPLASRLDVSLTRQGRGGVMVSPYLSIMNVYNARNPFAYVYDHDNHPPSRFGLPQLPLFPTVGVSVVW